MRYWPGQTEEKCSQEVTCESSEEDARGCQRSARLQSSAARQVLTTAQAGTEPGSNLGAQPCQTVYDLY